MQVEELGIAGAWVFTPVQHGDERGRFLEWYREDVFTATTGAPLHVAQANNSVSRRNVLRGLHFADVPPGQGKYVYCPRGAVRDVVVDLRVGSPTFGRWEAVLLDDVDRRALYLSEGLGHGFVALSDEASLTYLCTTPYTPGREHTVAPFDPDLAVDWGVADPLLSPRDAAAPSLEEALATGLLPHWDTCQTWYAGQRSAPQRGV